jgi:hypothetical protein
MVKMMRVYSLKGHAMAIAYYPEQGDETDWEPDTR